MSPQARMVPTSSWSEAKWSSSDLIGGASKSTLREFEPLVNWGGVSCIWVTSLRAYTSLCGHPWPFLLPRLEKLFWSDSSHESTHLLSNLLSPTLTERY
ncbi:hypothetical protein BDR05DRAFT_997651 [Suillus weaverae]|nr:hypothetical protein BDR05DRAFT_997651 [Suillus weaverae]